MHVVIAGAGVAALEATAALRSLAADRVQLTLVAPDRTYVTRALQPLSAFGVTAPPQVSVRDLADRLGADLARDRVHWVDRDGRTAHCRSGAAIAFDALMIGVGAAPHIRFPQALALHDGAAPGLTQLVAEITSGDVRRVAFVAPERMAWPLPLYEAALMTATLGRRHHRRLDLTLITAEAAALQPFGEDATAEMQALLDHHGVALVTSTHCRIPANDRVLLTSERGDHVGELAVDRVVALPELTGPHLRGLPSAPCGFIPIDLFCRVAGSTDVYAAGDGADYPVKHGGIAAQQADVAARCIAAAAGADVEPRPFHPTIHGMLLTGESPRYLTARLIGGHPFGSAVSSADSATTAASAKVVARYLAGLLDEVGR